MKRRRLVLGLREVLLQAQESVMNEEALKTYLKKVQAEFIRRMDEIGAEESGSNDEDEQSKDDENGGTVEGQSQRWQGAREVDAHGGVIEIPDDESENETSEPEAGSVLISI